MPREPFARAAVIGSGIAGLLTARVLSDFFGEVILFEKDAVPTTPGFRRGIPQGHHFHALIPGGMRILMELLPGVDADLRKAGSILPAPDQVYYYRPEGKSFRQTTYVPEPPADSGDRFMYVQTRGLLEHCVRARVEAIPNVTPRYETSVSDVAVRDGRVSGVILAGSPGQQVDADLVIDATGRSTRMLGWLDRLGYPHPAEEVIHCDFAYTTVFMKPRDPAAFSDVCFLILPQGGGDAPSRGGGLIRVEGGLWMVAAGGRYGEYPPRDFDGLMRFIEKLPVSRLHELASQAEPVGEPAHFRFARSWRRRFDQLEAFPAGVLPVGDAISHYNPMYGQGMAAACRQAVALRTALSEEAAAGRGLASLWRAFFPQAYQETRSPWLFAALGDFRDPRCTGAFPMTELPTLAGMQFLAAEAAGGDAEARRTLEAIASLELRIDVLERSPWKERIAGGHEPTAAMMETIGSQP